MAQFNKQWTLKVILFTGLLLMNACTPPDPPQVATEPINENFEITTDEYAQLADSALNHLLNLNLDAWSKMLADDIEYYFPDGDAGTRTKLNGKGEVMEWWVNWKNTSGIEKMNYKNSVHIPVIAKKSLKYTGLTGEIVLSYFSNEMVYAGTPVSVRMHFAAHFNKAKLIDRYYTYYDRTPIINTVKYNILDPHNIQQE